MKSVYIGENRVLTRVLDRSNMVVPTDDLLTYSQLILDGVYDVPLTNWIIKNVYPGMTLVDAGANIGYFTQLFGLIVGATGKVYAFEPNVRLISVLKTNINMYHMKNVSILNVAIHAERGTKMLGVCDRFHGNSSLRKRPGYETNFDDQTYEIEVETTTLDSALADIEGIDVLKMDIEGSECDALLGASRLLMGKKIKTLILEWNPDLLGADASKLIDILRENFNKVGYPEKDGEITPIEIDELPRYSFISNLICTKKL